ncbi:uncharacterized protein N7529_000652 [Penicillium soppii]|uniref:uncharacterized protein n=1 Tax=Penicillium soppii TaxID=69789 RepID=UPI0025467D9C|nr:uncharacterized protein N7529_000652 [Penicillium soppii]KAJ5881980.1 hypothetical protein N7529_000652 [Penicillium soppii]
MSAPNPGRQSPEPETQSGAQQQDTPGTGRTSVGTHPSPGHSAHESEKTKSTLESNPAHRLAEIEAEKYGNEKNKHD